MDEGSSKVAYHDDEHRDLERLVEAFGTAFSLDDIASSYCQANRSVDMAGEILYTRGCTSTCSAGSFASKDEVEVVSASSLELSSVKEDSSSTSSGLSSDNLLQKSNNEMRISRVSKAKKCSASMGTVSSVIGKDYARSKPQKYESYEATKPMKLDSKHLPISEIWSEKVPPSTTAGNDAMHKDVESFIFQMLGNGFELDTNVIQEVLGLCGYDIEKSVEKLLDLSASTLGMNDDGLAAENLTGKCPDQDYLLCRGKVRKLETNKRCGDGTGLMARTEIGSANLEGSKYNVQKGILEALFTAPERGEKPTRRSLVRAVRRPRIFGKVVVEPFADTDITIKRRTSTASMLGAEDDNEDDEFSYEVLRKAVKEHWITMKEYYKSAVEAFSKGDHNRANKLLEKGQFFNTKAREADEKSVQKLFKSRDEDWYLDLRDHEPKEALRLLKTHLKSICGIPSYQYLKVIVGTDDKDPKMTLKRRITKELEKQSIKWTEEENGSTMSIQLDEINPKSSSFSKRE